jgi:hypothetical protein
VSLKDDVRWARQEHLWADLYTGQDPRCVRVIPVEALRAWTEKRKFQSSGWATLDELLAELEGLDEHRNVDTGRRIRLD